MPSVDSSGVRLLGGSFTELLLDLVFHLAWKLAMARFDLLSFYAVLQSTRDISALRYCVVASTLWVPLSPGFRTKRTSLAFAGWIVGIFGYKEFICQ
jgi:hypothetical protein